MRDLAAFFWPLGLALICWPLPVFVWAVWEAES